MKKILFVLPILFLLSTGCGSDEVKPSTATNPTKLKSQSPESLAQSGEENRKNADQIFLLAATQNTDKPTTPSKQAQKVIDQAWEKFYKGDFDLSISDFKNAYTIDPQSPNPNVPEFYLTLGVILGKRKDYEGSIQILSKGEEVFPKHTRIICTLAFDYVNKYINNPGTNSESLNTALANFKKADAIDPNDANCQYFWSFAEYYKGNYAESWKHVNKLKKLGATMDAAFLQDLSKKMPQPK